MKKIMNLKSKNFRSIIYVLIISMTSNFQAFSSQELEEVNNVNLKAKITNTDFVERAKDKHALIQEKRTLLENIYKALKQLRNKNAVKYLANLVIEDLKPKFVELVSNNFIEENINVPSKEVKKIKEIYKENLSNNDEKKLNIFSPTRHDHWPGSRERKDMINRLQNDNIYVQHRLTNSSNLSRMDTQRKDIESFSTDTEIKKAQLESVLDNKLEMKKAKREMKEDTRRQLEAQKNEMKEDTRKQLEAQKNEMKEDTRKQLEEMTERFNFLMQTNNVNGNDNFICPITLELYQDPIITRCGHTFEHLPLISWLSQDPTCPSCRKDVNEDDLSPNISLRNVIQKLGNKPKKQMNNFNLIEIKEEKKDAQEE